MSSRWKRARRTSKASAQIPQRELVRNALRMRPDRIIVGEVRGPEAFDMLQAMNTGHDGSMSTIHANTPRDALVPPRKHGADGQRQPAAAGDPAADRQRHRPGRADRAHARRHPPGRCRSSKSAAWKARSSRPATSSPSSITARGATGGFEGTFEPTRLRPDLAVRAAQYGLEKQLLEAVGIGAGE